MARVGRKGGIWQNMAKGGVWYATVGGRKTRLHEDRDEAERIYHDLKSKETAPELLDLNPLKVIFNLYLDHLLRTSSKNVYRQARYALQNFHDAHPTLRVTDLRAVHVQQWWNSHPDWSDSTKNNYFGRISAALSWACKPENRFCHSNPVAGMTRPPCRSRGEEALVSQEDHKRLVAAANPCLADLLEALRQTGTRPSNLLRITAADVDFEKCRIVVEKHKTRKTTNKPIYLPMTSTMQAICKRLCAKHPTGCIFRTLKGKDWTYINVRERVGRLATRLGIKFYAYKYRHTMATELLSAGVPDAHVAQVLNHKDTDMIHHHYSHLAGSIKVLAESMSGIIPSGKTT